MDTGNDVDYIEEVKVKSNDRMYCTSREDEIHRLAAACLVVLDVTVVLAGRISLIDRRGGRRQSGRQQRFAGRTSRRVRCDCTGEKFAGRSIGSATTLTAVLLQHGATRAGSGVFHQGLFGQPFDEFSLATGAAL